jgi:hypothetical protein
MCTRTDEGAPNSSQAETFDIEIGGAMHAACIMQEHGSNVVTCGINRVARELNNDEIQMIGNQIARANLQKMGQVWWSARTKCRQSINARPT